MKNRYKSDQKAQALVEFALALPLLLLLVFGVLEFGRAFKTKIVLTNAAREGSHYFMYDKDDQPGFVNTTDTVVAEAFNSGILIDPSKVKVVCFMDADFDSVVDAGEEDDCSGTGPTRSTVVVTVTNDFNPVLLGWFGTMTIQGESRMLVP